jgi:glucosamine--fructose-6-phosphate aminotransferase (isomerizing)
MVQMWEEIFEQSEVLKKCAAYNGATIAGLVKELERKAADTAVIAARGTSDHAGIYGKYIMEYYKGLPVAMAAPSIVTIYQRKMNFKDKLVIGISQSGRAADVLEVVGRANESGAVTVGITNDPDSPLAGEARYRLFCNAGVEKSVAATKTFIAEMLLLAQLTAEWSGDGQLRKGLEELPGGIDGILGEKDNIINKVQRYRYMNECFVLARGINYPIAMETALKLQETCYVRARAYSTSDFQHGPLAMIEKDMPVIVFAPRGPSFEDVCEMLKKLKSLEAELIVVSDDPVALEMADSAFRIPQTGSDALSPFYNIVIAQMFACRLALAKGLNPDAPRGLKKITVTK